MSNFGSKYGDVLTMILVVVIVVILGIVGYFGYDVYNKNTKNANAQTALAEFEEATKSVRKKPQNKVQEENTVTTDENVYVPTAEEIQNSINAAQGNEEPAVEEEPTEEPKKVMYEGYEMKGKISIPKTKCNYPILAEVTKKSIEVAVAILYGPGLNEPGNTVIVGHNYRNGMFFSDNDKLAIGDTIEITSTTETVTYEIYNIYQTSADDASYMKRDTGGAREISLSTCTDDSVNRLIIWAKERV